MALPPAGTRRLLVVVPAFNEAASVGGVVAAVRCAVPDADVVVVDDGSVDATSATAASAGAKVLRLPFNLGVGAAMRTGYRFAYEHGYDAVVQVDADGQHDPAYLEPLIAGLDGASIVVGARFAGTDSYRVRGPRRWAMRLLAAALSRVARTRLTDVTSGFRAVDRDALRLFSRNYPAEYLGDTVESLVLAARSGLVVRQVPVAMHPRLQGRASQSPLSATLYLARAVLALSLAMIRSRDIALPPILDRRDPQTPPEVP